jgi:hypothetical protein
MEAKVGLEQEVPATLLNWLSARILLVPAGIWRHPERKKDETRPLRFQSSLPARIHRGSHGRSD